MAIVLDPEFGAQLFALAERHPVWVVDSPTNRPIIEALWSQRRHEKEPREVNVFRAIDGVSPADHVLALLRSVDAAHGPAVQEPPFATLIVDGAALDDALIAALRARGAVSVEPTGRGLRASFRDTAHARARD
ncbi:MAG TPA: hypothetical protein VHM30_18935 [Gemmatimonadaceae bacterium]|nr:hypothetical protein [Gemmatimonadaceae bacterium]